MTAMLSDLPNVAPSIDDLSYFEPNPSELRGNSAEIDGAHEEYWARVNAGEKVDQEEFVARFPAAIQSSLMKLLTAGQLLDDRHYTVEDPKEIVWPRLGETVDGLKIERVLGCGGFGRVYLVWDQNINRHDVLKVSIGSAEAQLAGPLAHRNVVPILTATTWPGGRSHIRMPLLGCATLADVLAAAFTSPGMVPTSAAVISQTGRQKAALANIPVPKTSANLKREPQTYFDGAIVLATRLATGVAFLHQHGICHRDLKPSNVLIDWDGQPIILDFNLAHNAATDLPRLGGTLPFMAPEQLQTMMGCPPAAPLDAKADVFSLGVLLYELFSGQHPFGQPPSDRKGERIESRVHANWLLGQHQSRCLRLDEMVPDIDRAVADLVDECLTYHPSERPTADAVAARLAKLSGWRHFLASRLRRPKWLATIGISTLIVAITVGIMGAKDRESPEARWIADAKRAINNGQPNKAVELMNRIVDQNKATAEVYFIRGVARMRERQFTTAADDFENAYTLDGDSRTLSCLAYCYGEINATVPCMDRVNRAEALGPLSAPLLSNRAMAIIRSASVNDRRERIAVYNGARMDLDRAIELDKNQQSAFFVRAFLSVRRALELKEFGDLPLAETDLDRAIANGPPATELFRYAAMVRALNPERNPQREQQMLDFIGKALTQGDVPATFCKDPAFDSWKTNPAFQAVLQTPVGLMPKHHVSWFNPLAGPIN